MMDILKRSYLVIFLATIMTVSMAALLTPQPVYAVDCNDDKNESILLIPKWYKYLEVNPDSTGKCTPTIANSSDALPIGIAALEGLLTVGALVSAAFVFVGSYRYILSVGNSEKATSARKTVINSLIGLVIIIISTGVVTFIGRTLSG